MGIRVQTPVPHREFPGEVPGVAVAVPESVGGGAGGARVGAGGGGGVGVAVRPGAEGEVRPADGEREAERVEGRGGGGGAGGGGDGGDGDGLGGGAERGVARGPGAIHVEALREGAHAHGAATPAGGKKWGKERQVERFRGRGGSVSGA